MNLHDLEHPDDTIAKRAAEAYRRVIPTSDWRRNTNPLTSQAYPFEVCDHADRDPRRWAPINRDLTMHWAERA